MKIGFLSLISAVLFGSYDLFIKLTANKSDPILNAMLVQISSAVTLVVIFLLQLLTSRPAVMIAVSDWKYPVLAGVLISLALYVLFIVLKSPLSQASSALSSILIGRNLVLIILSLLVLKEKLTRLQILGLILGLLGLKLINL